MCLPVPGQYDGQADDRAGLTIGQTTKVALVDGRHVDLNVNAIGEWPADS